MVYDIICLWCYAGNQRLAHAVQKTKVAVNINLIPFQIRSHLPQKGISIHEYGKGKGILDVNTADEKGKEALESEGLLLSELFLQRFLIF
ncbi:DsbA family protein [Wenyingzhuangia sp. 1_MG-2023]|nr:DsbA family protein [Wenyingzhuangia sp. 1_MG-2023]